MNKLSLELNMEFDKLINFTEFATTSILIDDMYYTEGASSNKIVALIESIIEKLKKLKDAFVKTMKSIFSKNSEEETVKKLKKLGNKKIKMYDKNKLDKEYEKVTKAMAQSKTKAQSSKILEKFKTHRGKIIASTTVVTAVGIAVLLNNLKKRNVVKQLEKEEEFYADVVNKLNSKYISNQYELAEHNNKVATISDKLMVLNMMQKDDIDFAKRASQIASLEKELDETSQIADSLQKRGELINKASSKRFESSLNAMTKAVYKKQ